jgi:hypothetical protein
VFSNFTPRRCDIQDDHIMIRQSPHSGLVYIMLDLEPYWEKDILESARLHQKPNVV